MFISNRLPYYFRTLKRNYIFYSIRNYTTYKFIIRFSYSLLGEHKFEHVWKLFKVCLIVLNIQ